MAEEIDHQLLWLWTAPELAALVAVFGLLVTSLVGRSRHFPWAAFEPGK